MNLYGLCMSKLFTIYLFVCSNQKYLNTKYFLKTSLAKCFRRSNNAILITDSKFYAQDSKGIEINTYTTMVNKLIEYLHINYNGQ